MKEGDFDKNIFKIFTRAQEVREEADYGLFPEINDTEAEKIIDKAENFVKECEEFS